MPKPGPAFPGISVGASFELARLIPGENTVTVEHKISPSNSADSFQFGPKSQISSGQSKNTECFRILTFNNCFQKFKFKLNFVWNLVFGTWSLFRVSILVFSIYMEFSCFLFYSCLASFKSKL
jgi:hypothetical protein